MTIIIGKRCEELIQKASEKLIDRPYRDKRFKKGFVMRPFNLETGQFQQGRGVGYRKNEKQ